MYSGALDEQNNGCRACVMSRIEQADSPCTRSSAFGMRKPAFAKK
jgi:hypothetical protein